MKQERVFITNEDDGKLDWDVNNAVMYSVVNKDAPNPYGEYKSYKIMPGKPKRPRNIRLPAKLDSYLQ